MRLMLTNSMNNTAVSAVGLYEHLTEDFHMISKELFRYV
jgi:hypothetical protein